MMTNKNFTGIVEMLTSKSWYFKGKLHRIDGPARIYANGRVEWYRNGLQLLLPEEIKIYQILLKAAYTNI
jgi:hypothetical protein